MKRILTLILAMMLLFTTVAYADSDHLGDNFETYVYVYAAKNDKIDGVLNPSGYYTIGRVLVKGLKPAHNNPTKEEYDLVMSQLSNIEYFETAPVTIDKISNWILKHEPKGADDYIKNTSTWHLDGEYIHSHNYITQTPATCTEDGLAKCECGEELVLEKLGHIVVEDPEVAPTCTETGVAAGTHCERCNEPLSGHETIDALGHDYKVTAHLDATCEKDGYTTYTCSRDESHTYTDPIKATGHNTIVVDPIEPTCTEVGYTEGSYCDKCNETLKEVTEIPALGHDLGEWVRVKAPTYSEKGLEERYCSRCDYFEQREVAKLVRPAGGAPNTGDNAKLGVLLIIMLIAAAGAYYTWKKMD